MSRLLIRYIPLAIAAISPVGVSIVVLLLSSKRGLVKAVAYLAANVFAFFVWGLVFLTLSVRLPTGEDSGPGAAALLIRTFLGIILIVLAIRTYATEQDPDEPPPKWKSMLDGMSLAMVCVASLLMGFTNLRFLILVMAGVEDIVYTRLPAGQTMLALLLLVVVVLWPQFVPLGLYLGAGKRAEQALAAMDRWLARNARVINTLILGLIGVLLVLTGLLTRPAA